MPPKRALQLVLKLIRVNTVRANLRNTPPTLIFRGFQSAIPETAPKGFFALFPRHAAQQPRGAPGNTTYARHAVETQASAGAEWVSQMVKAGVRRDAIIAPNGVGLVSLNHDWLAQARSEQLAPDGNWAVIFGDALRLPARWLPFLNGMSLHCHFDINGTLKPPLPGRANSSRP
jgi:hypothetical protein